MHEAYLDALEKELSSLERPREVTTLYFGGGTPTQLHTEQLERLCELARRWHPLSPGGEWTVEANPADLSAEKTDTLTRAGVTRISLGAQSFDAEKLRRLERDHAAKDIKNAVDRIRAAGLQVALDLIFAAPEETLDGWRRDLEAAIRLAPDHVSTYGLTFERGTAFWSRLLKGELERADEYLERTMYATAIDRLAEAGFEHYEVSNFALPGRRSRHNEVYWAGMSYFAAGPGAARYVDGVRSTNHRSTSTWLRRVMAGESPVAESERLGPEDVARETLVFSMRRMEGIERAAFERQTGFALDRLVGEALRRHVEFGLLEDDGRRVRLTREGLFVSDSIWPDFLRE